VVKGSALDCRRTAHTFCEMHLRLLLIAAATALATVTLLPTLAPEHAPDWSPGSALFLDLPVQTGIQVVMNVEVEELVWSRVHREAAMLADPSLVPDLPLTSVAHPVDDELVITSPATASEVSRALQENIGLYTHIDSEGDAHRFRLEAQSRSRMEDWAVENAVIYFEQMAEEDCWDSVRIKRRGAQQIRIQMHGERAWFGYQCP
jgi:hypothetical protein